MLRELLQAVEAAEGPITLVELSRRLNVDPGVLEGMLEHWARRGKLVMSGGSAAACAGACAAGGCASGCPFMARLPRSYALTAEPERV